MDPIYFTDNYPRSGCSLVIDVQREGFSLSVLEPKGKRIEAYGTVKSAHAISRMVSEWCAGLVPRLSATPTPEPETTQEAA